MASISIFEDRDLTRCRVVGYNKRGKHLHMYQQQLEPVPTESNDSTSQNDADSSNLNNSSAILTINRIAVINIMEKKDGKS